MFSSRSRLLLRRRVPVGGRRVGRKECRGEAERELLAQRTAAFDSRSRNIPTGIAGDGGWLASGSAAGRAAGCGTGRAKSKDPVEEFKNDPLIKKALEIFAGEIQTSSK